MAVERNGHEEPAGDQVVDDHQKDDFSISVAMLQEKLSRSSNDSYICRVPHQLRQVNPSAYEPQIISIGPYYRGKPHLMAMEKHKCGYLKGLLDRTKEDNAERYVEAMRRSENKARSCYADLNMNSQSFVHMLVLDGCFVIELIRKFASDELAVEGDDLFKRNFNLSILGQELLLVENQLPFFILEELFDLSKVSTEDQTLVEMAHKFFAGIVPGPGIRAENYHISVAVNMEVYSVDCSVMKHLIELVHHHWLPSFEGIKRFHQQLETSSDRKWNFIRSASELSEVGIKFKKVVGDNSSLFDVKFDKEQGRFEIPTLTIYHDTERIFRNLIAYEQLTQGPTYVMDYARLMDSLINHGDDVALLSRCGIIVNWLGSDDEVARMFNKLNNYVYLSTANFYYSEIFNDVNKYCRNPWISWKVKLRKKYFHTPWDWVLTSIIAGVILLLLTLVQTVFSVLSYFKQGS